MCSITAGFDTEKLLPLLRQNMTRGNFTHSVAQFAYSGEMKRNDRYGHSLALGSGLVTIVDAVLDTPTYKIIHMQAPTGASGVKTEHIHPAETDRFLLWHNGILKDKTIADIREDLRLDDTWDTMLLAKSFEFLGDTWTDALSEIDGSFACILYDKKLKKLYVFRTQSAPLFWDEALTISSTTFNGAEEVPYGVVYELELLENATPTVTTFQAKDNPYFMPEEKKFPQAPVVSPQAAMYLEKDKLIAAAHYYKEAMELIGVSFEGDDVKETPMRVMKMWREVFCSVGQTLKAVKEVSDPTCEIKLMQFDKGHYNQLVTCQNIPFISTCSHHHVFFPGKGHIGYLPGEGLMGLSKMARVLEFYSRMPQSQENICEQVAKFIFENVKPAFVIVFLQATHMCMSARGVKKPGSFTSTSKIMANPKLVGDVAVTELKNEFFQILSLGNGFQMT